MAIIAVIWWIITGMMVLVPSREVTKSDYLCCWVSLMMMLIYYVR